MGATLAGVLGTFGRAYLAAHSLSTRVRHQNLNFAEIATGDSMESMT